MIFSLDSLRFKRSIRDPLHGTINVSDEEIAIIDHPLFRRLHHIRQNGLLYYVFPSASHTRFEHSLGVLHVATSLFWALIQNSHTSMTKSALKNVEDAASGEAIAFHKIHPDILSDLLTLVRIAALVHDLGHGPFSHHFDAFAPRAEVIARLIRANPDLQLPDALTQALESREGKGVKHEHMSCLFFAQVWKACRAENLGKKFNATELPSLITAIILGDPFSSCLKGHELEPYLALLHDMVASAPIDADRMDYMERDSRSVGVSYGLYDKERVLKSFLVFRENDRFRLGIKVSGIRAVENFIQARFELFVQVYYHKTNRATQVMLEKIAAMGAEQNLSLITTENLEELVERYVVLSDERFLSILNGERFAEFSTSIPREIQELASLLSQRKLWKRVAEPQKSEMEATVQALRKHCKDDLHPDYIDPKATKDLDEGARILRRSASGIYEADPSLKWTEKSAMIGALHREESNISRIYYSGTDLAEYKMLRQHARELPIAKID